MLVWIGRIELPSLAWQANILPLNHIHMRTLAQRGLCHITVSAENLKSRWETVLAEPFVDHATGTNPTCSLSYNFSMAGTIVIHVVDHQKCWV